MPYFLSLPESSWAPGKPGGLREPSGANAFPMGKSSVRAVRPKPSACGCTTAGDCHLLAGVTHWGKEAFKPLPAVGTAFWMNNNIDGGLPVRHEGQAGMRRELCRSFPERLRALLTGS